jgi:hypothetical protein
LVLDDEVIMGWRSLFDSAKCLTGFHDWTDWSARPPGQCTQTRRCRRSGCDKSESRELHDWSEFEYVARNSCLQRRVCARDCTEETRIADHHWSDWQYVSTRNCNQERKCSRCEEPDEQVLHVWGDWRREPHAPGIEVRTCQRCREGREERSRDLSSIIGRRREQKEIEEDLLSLLIPGEDYLLAIDARDEESFLVCSNKRLVICERRFSWRTTNIPFRNLKSNWNDSPWKARN